MYARELCYVLVFLLFYHVVENPAAIDCFDCERVDLYALLSPTTCESTELEIVPHMGPYNLVSEQDRL